MPSRSQRQAKQIVVRSIEPGSRHTTKSVLGTLTKLNQAKPAHAIKRSDWVLAWNKPKQRPPVCPPRMARRNPGRDNGETWMSPHYVSGRAMGPVWDGGESDDVWETDVRDEWAREDVDAEESVRGHDRSQERREVQLMDIAKPMKPKGAATPGVRKEFEMVEAVERVIALEEDQLSEWASQISDDSELDALEWDMLDDGSQQGTGSYADMVQLRPD
ncbi:hypothetical protein TRAPUB_5275 [Trametes pubescens]|uniref:Uncharacterized protein n=1 Tax=Trametes pubescens TaxID=154538 RepID=A0A1M2V921_TRAPU|nr:hypothetical protein TRAPUB_5275 [Trametes pubescens]